VPLLGNQGLGVAALSYVDSFDVGVLSNPDVCPDVEVFCQGFERALRQLAESKVPSPADHPPLDDPSLRRAQ
jgi:WS/DGAT C-terminal domain